MQFSTAWMMLAVAVAALPPSLAIGLLDFDQLANYQMLGCDVGSAQIPTSQTVSVTTGQALTVPFSNQTVVKVALGRGTQNYTCADGNATAAPFAVGAKANLYDASCLALYAPQLLHQMPAYLFGLSDAQEAQIATRLQQISGKSMLIAHHLFTPDSTTPTFNFQLNGDPDIFVGKKLENVPAPSTATKGANGAVDWLRLVTKAGTVGDFDVAYRVNTAGGAQTKTCKGQPTHFEMPYAAEYWFYAAKDDA